jgi:hypothetical protein
VSEKRKFQLNIKFGGGYEAPLLNIEGDDEQEFRANVAFAMDNVEELVKATTLFQAAYNVHKPQDNPPPSVPQTTVAGATGHSWSSGGSQQTQQQPADQAQDTQPPGPPPVCRHGAMNWKPPGYSQRTKRNYSGFWTCTGPRNDQCASVNP